MTKVRTLRLAGALAALGALTVVGAGAEAAAASAPADKAGATVITMERDGKKLFFDGPGDGRRRRPI